nr:dimethylsulfonioproprionate lyase family protein [uncultured Dongia sp.]
MNPFLALTRAIAASIDRLPVQLDDAGRAARHLADAARGARPAVAFASADHDHGHDYDPILRSALTPDGGIMDAIAALNERLPWSYHYPKLAHDPDLDRRVAFAELIGPSGPLRNGNSVVGFTLMAPETFYPLHSHPAVELYMVVSGKAQWIVPEREQIVPPGGFVLHHSGQPHAMRTLAEPLLAIYDWQGDLESPSVYL